MEQKNTVSDFFHDVHMRTVNSTVSTRLLHMYKTMDRSRMDDEGYIRKVYEQMLPLYLESRDIWSRGKIRDDQFIYNFIHPVIKGIQGAAFGLFLVIAFSFLSVILSVFGLKIPGIAGEIITLALILGGGAYMYFIENSTKKEWQAFETEFVRIRDIFC